MMKKPRMRKIPQRLAAPMSITPKEPPVSWPKYPNIPQTPKVSETAPVICPAIFSHRKKEGTLFIKIIRTKIIKKPAIRRIPQPKAAHIADAIVCKPEVI